jgi:hypothetical protein
MKNINCLRTPKEVMSKKLTLKIFEQEIPIDLHPKYLGLILDK